MAYFEFKYFGEAHRPVVADMYANSDDELHRIRIGQIDQPHGSSYRAHVFLPGAATREHPTKQDAARDMLNEASRWLRRMNLSIGAQ